jgi:hypothetical protein
MFQPLKRPFGFLGLLSSQIFWVILPILFLMLKQFILKTLVTTVATLIGSGCFQKSAMAHLLLGTDMIDS